jgi:hypothetical protein
MKFFGKKDSNTAPGATASPVNKTPLAADAAEKWSVGSDVRDIAHDKRVSIEEAVSIFAENSNLSKDEITECVSLYDSWAVEPDLFS